MKVLLWCCGLPFYYRSILESTVGQEKVVDSSIMNVITFRKTMITSIMDFIKLWTSPHDGLQQIIDFTT